ncbi:unnamed protein product [Paramecium octaurelia]|uniref:Uncharacterized protein n=1 Tax=Paramecium octaurelia TaxID=43137 RepID=A0A8S1VG96_PAROT|nr:unnamed protein product [Paramecium octaurelia]
MEKIGEIEAIQQEIKNDCKASNIFSKPLIKIIILDQNERHQVFVITVKRETSLIITKDNVAYLIKTQNMEYLKNKQEIPNKLGKLYKNMKVAQNTIV